MSEEDAIVWRTDHHSLQRAGHDVTWSPARGCSDNAGLFLPLPCGLAQAIADVCAAALAIVADA